MRLRIISFVSIITTTGLAQHADCKEQVERIPNMFTHQTQVRDSLIDADYYIFEHCCGLDSLDLQMLGPFVGTYVIRRMISSHDTLNYQETADAYRYYSTSWRIDATSNEQKRKQMVEELARNRRVDGAATGFAGTRSGTYICFDTLMRVTSNEDLIKLTDHSSPAVRVYAFWGLAKRHHADLTMVLEQHLADTARISKMFGCNVWSSRVNELMIDLISPDFSWDWGCTKFTAEEIAEFRRRMAVVKP